MREPLVRGIQNRLLQLLALHAPGAQTVRPALHRARGVRIGRGCFVGTSAIIETAHPELVTIGHNVSIGIRVVVVAHFHGSTRADRSGSQRTPTVVIGDDVFIGPGAIILPNVTIGPGSVVAAGSVVTSSVASLTMVQGNPARPIARCGVPLTMGTSLREFYRHLKPFRSSLADGMARRSLHAAAPGDRTQEP